MRDYTIRLALKESKLAAIANHGDTVIIDELPLPIAKARIDVAVVNGKLHGYEIKSACDTLQRLDAQLIAYRTVFDYITVVSEAKHKDKILHLLPAEVGLIICSETKKGVKFSLAKKAKRNPFVKPEYLAKLLWRNELVDILLKFGLRFRSQDRNWILCKILAENIHIDILSEEVRTRLKQRLL